MLKLLALLIGITQAQAQTAPSYLLFSSQALCLARSQAQCQALGCDGVNVVYWWDCSTGPLKSGLVGPNAVTAGSYALRVAPSGPFAAVHPQRAVGLTAQEQSKLATTLAIAPVLPPVVILSPAVTP